MRILVCGDILPVASAVTTTITQQQSQNIIKPTYLVYDFVKTTRYYTNKYI